MEQLIFELAPAEPPRLANFLPGRNDELVALLPRFVSGDVDETGLLLWGEAGAGKTHLLRAAIAVARERGIAARWLADPGELALAPIDTSDALAVIDRVDTADDAAAAAIFSLYNALKQRRGRLIAASRSPLAALPLREDLRTRLGWGLVYEVLSLSDDDKPAAMAAFASQRGFVLSAEVIDYLLRHGRRDLPSLLATLGALDRASLATRRPITVPLLKAWLRQTGE
jgi:DnaA family protein